MLLKQVKYIYELTPFGALALRPRCETSSPALAILEVDPSGNPISSCWEEVSNRGPSGGGRETLPNRSALSGNPIQFVLFLNQRMEEQ